MTSYRSIVSENRIENHAKNLLSAIGQLRDADGTNDRAIIFIAHSLGGLVCMDALLASKNSADPHLKAILSQTLGVAFLGTPHTGSALADWAELIAKSLGVIKQVNSDIISVLRAQSEVLLRIQNDFHTMLRDRTQLGEYPMNITCFFEELSLPGVGMVCIRYETFRCSINAPQVVPRNSASLPQYISIGIHANHINMTKFSDSQDPGFTSIVREIQRWIRKSRESVSVSGQRASGASLVI